jgi:hypothetical protein
MPTLTAYITDGADDAQEAGGTPVVTQTSVNCATSNAYIGLRFQGTGLTQGAIINSAVLKLYLPSGSYDTPNVTQYGQLISNAPTFTTNTNDISGRTLTQASVPWTSTGGGSGWRQPPDIATVLQEIVDQDDWVEDNYFAIIMRGNSTTSSPLRISAYEGGMSTRPYIIIDYTEPAGGPHPGIVAHHRRILMSVY